VINYNANGMPPTPKRRVKKPKQKKADKTPELKTIEETFPNITKATLEQLNNFYKIGLSARLASQQPGMPGRESVRKVFLYFDGELMDEYDLNANERQKLAKQKLKDSFERILLKLEIQLAKVEKALASEWDSWQEKAVALAKLNPPELPKPFIADVKSERLRLTVMQTILETRDHIATTDYTLTIHEGDEAEMLQHLQKKVDLMSSTEDPKKLLKKVKR